MADAPGDADAALDGWILRSYPHGTRLGRDALRELYDEDREWHARRYAESAEARQLADLGRRLALIERTLLDRNGDLAGPLVSVLASVISAESKRTAAAIDKAIAAAFDERCPMTFKGTFDERLSYDRGAVVIHSGSLWVALAPTCGERPGKSVDWRLAVKAGTAKELSYA